MSVPTVPLAPPEHEDVDRRAGGADVGEDPREELAAFDVGLDGGRGRPGVVQADVRDARPGAAPRTLQSLPAHQRT